MFERTPPHSSITCNGFPTLTSDFTSTHFSWCPAAHDDVGQEERTAVLPGVLVLENIPDLFVLYGLATAESAWLQAHVVSTRCEATRFRRRTHSRHWSKRDRRLHNRLCPRR